ncbi:MAG: T9SS type A sorting domain-containing protein, partial [Bacteroidales bacterium]|nr:T9SS type A sorting domain-containing protein [Bacteroidales bacterium]
TAEGTSLSIYPNPTTSATTIALSGVNGEVTITIVDMNGRVVMSDSMSCEGDCTKTMEVSGLAQGAYFVRISGESTNMVKKLVVK